MNNPQMTKEEMASTLGNGKETMNNQNDTADSVSAKLSPREEFALRCLNAAVNLYGALTYDEFVNLYNRYAADKMPEIAAEMTAAELPDLIERLQRAAEIDYESDDDRDVAGDKPQRLVFHVGDRR